MKRIISLILALAMCISISVVAFADSPTAPEEIEEELVIPADQPRAEETEWYYRILDNYYVQRRLWSITYRKWLTDWITIGYVDPNHP